MPTTRGNKMVKTNSTKNKNTKNAEKNTKTTKTTETKIKNTKKTETTTQRKRRLQKEKDKYKAKRAKESEDQTNSRLQKRREKLAAETPEQREARLKDIRERKTERLAMETPEQYEARLKESREKKRERLASETPEQYAARLKESREKQRERLASETPERYEARLKESREKQRERLAWETPEHRELRLNEQRERTQRCRAKNLQAFENAINTFCIHVCDICTKRCYPNQVHTVRFNVAALTYLPVELNSKPSLILCSRCQTHVTSNKTIAPPKAFWNNLDPGFIPDVIRTLTQAEQRLLCRIIPFLKIVKFSGLYGQYGFRGQAVLFAQDIFEVSERLPNMLPRSSSQVGIIVVTERLENLSKTREFTICREKVYSALRWLITNNPLYRDVRIDNYAQIDDQELVRLSVPELPEEEVSERNVIRNAFIPINDVARIIRASWHQGDHNVFTSGYAGVQCSAMSLANIVRAAILNPNQWDVNILNTNMLAGDSLYCRIRAQLQPNELDETGYLEMRNFNVVRQNLQMYDKQFSIDYDDDTLLFGSLQDVVNNNYIGITLLTALTRLFDGHSAGILTASNKSVSVFRSEDKYYFADSHSCGPKGKPTPENGRACFIECDNLQELCRICKRCLGSRNIAYTLTRIDVSLREDIITHQGVQVQQQKDIITHQAVSNSRSETIPIQTSIMLPIDRVQPDVEDELEVSENVNEIRRKTNNNIVNETYEIKAEEFAWYQLFPYGKNGFKEQRPVKISPLDYYQFRILGADTRFQRNDYLFYALSMFVYYRVKSTIAACGRRVEGENGNRVEDLHLYLKNLRGSAAYWRSALSDLIAQIRCLGPPTYFVTLSCNDLHWVDMKKALLMSDSKEHINPDDIDIQETQRLIEMYPVVVSRHFMVRVNALMQFLKSDTEIFGGKVQDHWWRIEFQNRGSPHLHMVVWVDDHPSVATPEGITRIDSVCSTAIPPETSEPHELVKSCQIHRHTSTCKKNNNTRTNEAHCRFNFPRSECLETHVIDPSSNEFIYNGGRICVLKRKSEDCWVNNYSPALLKMWKANMDIQPCGTNESIAYYIAKYVSKSEPTNLDGEVTRAIQQIRREETDVSRKLFKICMHILKERQVSACECVFRLCHLSMRESSRKTIFVNTRKPEQRYKVLKFNEAGQAAGYCANIFERYEKRPAEHPNYDFNNMCLIEFAMLFEPHYTKPPVINEESIDTDSYIPQHEQTVKRRLITLIDNTKMTIRNTPAVIRVPNFVAASDPESYYYSLLLQYMPYRIEAELLGDFNSARDAFLANEERLKETNNYLEIYRERDRQLENAFAQVHAFQILEQAEPIELDNEEEVPYLPMNQDQFIQAKQPMNAGQKEIFTMVTQSIQNQMSGSEERLKIFFTGGAGVGKTFLLRLLRDQINRCYAKDAVEVCALTGVAARLINGATIHSTLKLPVQKDGRITGMSPLSGNFLRIMRQQWHETEFLIVDEISMVSYQMLCMMDARLRQIKNCEDEFFGGINVLLFGDLLQLPPIKQSGTPVFKQPEYLQPATHLWRLFTLCELTENMRQQGDHTFIDILNALRVGELTAQHFSILMGRFLEDTSDDFSIDKALRVYPTNQQVNDHNSAVLNLFRNKGARIYKIKAQDQLVHAARNADKVDIATIIPADINKTGGLPAELEIFVGAKVMLRSNIDVSKGLVNGAIGYINEIVWPLFRRTQMYATDVPSVRIDFARDGVHLIHPKAIQFPAKFNYWTAERRMLPLILSWASTVHKMQGSTVDHAVVYLGAKLFEEGQAYVALSRVRSLEGLRIEEFDCNKLTGKKPCNNEALNELNRMRSKN